MMTKPHIAGPIFNQDSTDFFYSNRAKDMSGELVDDYIDQLADAGIGTYFSCTNAMKANHASKVWETDWHGYDPKGTDDQAILSCAVENGLANTRNRLDGAKRLADMGVHYHQRVLARCRERGVGAWVSVRLNDVHACMDEESPNLSTFYKEQRANGQLRGSNRDAFWIDRALDWERPEVQEHFFKFVEELLETIDMDGVELDWMRFGFHFRPGRELEGGRIITTWMRRVRVACDEAAKRLSHPVLLGVRVPSRPESARRMGFDAVAWAREALVDLIVPTPFWATTDFDMPMTEWRRLLDGTDVQLAGGLEVRYQPVPNGPAMMMTPELATGAACALMAGGADQVYLFNYFPRTSYMSEGWGAEVMNRIFRAMRDVAELEQLARRHAVTYHDVRAPGEPRDNALPATDHQRDMPLPSGCAFRLQTGSKPKGRSIRLLLEFEPGGIAPSELKVYVNSVPCALRAVSGHSVATYDVPCELMQEEAQVVDVVGGEPAAYTIVRVEMSVSAA